MYIYQLLQLLLLLLSSSVIILYCTEWKLFFLCGVSCQVAAKKRKSWFVICTLVDEIIKDSMFVFSHYKVFDNDFDRMLRTNHCKGVEIAFFLKQQFLNVSNKIAMDEINKDLSML